MLEKGAYNILSFGPGLVNNGEIIVSTNTEVAKAMVNNTRCQWFLKMFQKSLTMLLLYMTNIQMKMEIEKNK